MMNTQGVRQSARSRTPSPSTGPVAVVRQALACVLLSTALPTPAAAQLEADFTALSTSGVVPLKVSFQDLSTGGTVNAWRWDFGDGGFSTFKHPQHVYAVPGSYTVSLTVSDGEQIDSTGFADFITVWPAQFGTQQVVASICHVYTIDTADLDGDGDVDLLSADFGDFKFDADRVAWWENTNGLGAFGPPQVITSDVQSPSRVCAADLDGDGDADFLLSSATVDGTLAWYENSDGLGAFGPPQVIAQGTDYGGGQAVDLDGDGDRDVLAAQFLDGDVAWCSNTDGQGAFGPAQAITGVLPILWSVFPVDLDGDGDVDVLTSSGLHVAWSENTDGAGGFGPQTVISGVSGFGGTGVFAEDVDGDGDMDVLTASPAGEVAWQANLDGLGSFGPTQVLATSHASVIAAADLDGDGDTDVLAGTEASGTVAWYENTDGLGGFGPAQLISDEKGLVRAFHLADLDGDGDAGLLVSSTSECQISWYPNTLFSPAWPCVGQGLAGSVGTPVLTGEGPLSADAIVTLTIGHALPGAASTLVVGLAAVGAAFKGGVLVPSPDLIFPGLPIDATGGLVLSDRWPPGVPGGVTLWFQHWLADPAGPHGLAASNGLSGTTSS